VTVTTHQPIFLPWPGFFFKALQADTMVLLDRVQFPLGRGWMTRNRLKSAHGELWLTVPVWKKGRGKQTIGDVQICNESDWKRKHIESIRQQYAHAPYLDEHLPHLESIYARNHRRLMDFNLELIRYFWSALNLRTRLLLQSELDVSGTGIDLLLSVCHAVQGDTYATFRPVEKHLDTQAFAVDGIQLRFAPFRPPIYPQLWGDFRYNLSALDLLLCHGPKSLDIIKASGKEATWRMSAAER
jgi:hypothetical protein